MCLSSAQLPSLSSSVTCRLQYLAFCPCHPLCFAGEHSLWLCKIPQGNGNKTKVDPLNNMNYEVWHGTVHSKNERHPPWLEWMIEMWYRLRDQNQSSKLWQGYQRLLIGSEGEGEGRCGTFYGTVVWASDSMQRNPASFRWVFFPKCSISVWHVLHLELLISSLTNLIPPPPSPPPPGSFEGARLPGSQTSNTMVS